MTSVNLKKLSPIVGLTDTINNNTQSNATSADRDPQSSSLSNLLMDIGSSSPSTTSSLAVTSLATYASLSLDDQAFEATTLTNSSSTATVTTTPIPNSSNQSVAAQTGLTNDGSTATNTSNSGQLPPVSTFTLPQFRDSNNQQYWWESNNKAAPGNSSSFNYTGQSIDGLQNNANYFSSLDQYSNSNGGVSNAYDYQYNGYHTEPTPGEYSSGFTSLTSTLSN